MRKIFVKIHYALWALKRINKPHLMDFVIYEGQRCALIQGVADPYWDLMPMNQENLNKDKRDIYRHIHVSKFKLDGSFKRKWWAFKSSYKFKMDNWFMIDTWKKPFFARISN